MDSTKKLCYSNLERYWIIILPLKIGTRKILRERGYRKFYKRTKITSITGRMNCMNLCSSMPTRDTYIETHYLLCCDLEYQINQEVQKNAKVGEN